MSKTNVVLIAAMLAISCSANAVTFAELAEKNAQYLNLKTDLAIAKAQADLAEQKAKTTGAAAKAEPVPAIQVSAAAKPVAVVSGAPASPKVAPEPAVDRGVYLNSIYGSKTLLSADFQQQNQPMTRRVGDQLSDGWLIVSIAYPHVVVTRPAVGKKPAECKRVAIGASVSNSPKC